MAYISLFYPYYQMLSKALLLLIVCSACQSASYEEFREKGRAKAKSLITELKKIRTKDQLIASEPGLKSAFDELTKLLDGAEQYRQAHPEREPMPLSDGDQEQSDQLCMELLRISRMEGGREILDRCRLKEKRSNDNAD